VTAPAVRVAVAVLRRRDGAVLLAQRLPGTPYAGYWEFPGGKLEPGETALQALHREIREELGVDIVRAHPWITQHYNYPHANVELAFFRVDAWHGDPAGRDGQAIAWQAPGAIEVAPLLPANSIVLRSLQLPEIYAVSMADELGDSQFLKSLSRALDAGVRLLQLREPGYDPVRLATLAEATLARAHAAGAQVLLNGDESTARQLGFDGVHWNARTLRSASVRPSRLLCGASCHDGAELAQATRLGVDFALLGPVKKTPTHPGASPLGWERFAALARDCEIPIYAIGGLEASDLASAQEHGAHGVALRRAAWSGRLFGISRR
jgi:8-oxo-dGTP diphosphatase